LFRFSALLCFSSFLLISSVPHNFIFSFSYSLIYNCIWNILISNVSSNSTLFLSFFLSLSPGLLPLFFFYCDAHLTLSRRTGTHRTRTQQPILQRDYYLRRIVTGASIMTEVTACQLLLASLSLSGPIRLTSPCNSVTAKSLTVPLGISTSVLSNKALQN
jgi:hypothetical protein